jgi:CRP-like cAMP-binding protein
MNSNRGRLRQALTAFERTVRVPNLRRAQLSFGAMWTSEWAVTVVVGILAFRHGGATAVGIVGLVRMLPAALLAPVAAGVVDRHRRENVLVGVGLVRTVTLCGAGLVAWGLSSPVPAYVLAAVATSSYTLYRPAHSALLPSICSTGTELTSANVVRGSLDSISALVGPLLAGALVGPINVDGVFGVCAALSLWSAWLISRVEYEAPPRLVEASPAPAARAAREGVAIIGRSRDVRLLTALVCAQTFTRGCFAVFAVVVALQLLGLHASGVGVLTAGFGAGAVIGSFATSMLVASSGLGQWLALGIGLWGLPFVALATVSNEVVAIALLAVVGVANAIVDVSAFTLLPWIVPDELMGRVFASFEALLTMSVAAGSLVTPGLIALFGVRGALVAAGLLGPLAALLAFVRLRNLDARLQVAGDTVSVMQRVAMLTPLPLATITQLAAHASNETASPGSVVIQEGTAGDDFYVIADGRAEVTVDGAPVGRLGPADCFGEIAALTGRRRTSTVRADTPMSLLRLSGLHFVRAVTGYAPSHAAASTLLDERLARAVSSTADQDESALPHS